MARVVPRSVFADWRPAEDRDPLGLLRAQDATRVPDLVPIRLERMRVSPFAFYRGGAAIMAADLAALPVTGWRVQACGDAHVLNFGAYGSPEREIVFDVNDFDETLPAPWEWDVLRLTASVELAAREIACAARQRRDAVAAAVSTYRNVMAHFAGVSPLDVWYEHIDVLDQAGLPGGVRPRNEVERDLASAAARTAEALMPKLTTGARPHFVDEPPFFRRIGIDAAEAGDVKEGLSNYRASLLPHVRVLLDRFELQDVAAKVVGVGSVGLRCYIALLLTDRDEPLLLQLKQAQASVLEPYAGPGAYPHGGQRVVEGQRLMQAASDIFLGWTTGNGVAYYVRQLRDMKASVDVGRLRPRDFVRYARLCGWTLAHAHARSGSPRDLAKHMGKTSAFDDSVAAFARRYADLTERDYEAFVAANPPSG